MAGGEPAVGGELGMDSTRRRRLNPIPEAPQVPEGLWDRARPTLVAPPKPPQLVQEPESTGARRPQISHKTAWQRKTELPSFSASRQRLRVDPALLKKP